MFFNGSWVTVYVEVGDGWISPFDGYYDDTGEDLTEDELDRIAARQDQLHMALHGVGGKNPNRVGNK